MLIHNMDKSSEEILAQILSMAYPLMRQNDPLIVGVQRVLNDLVMNNTMKLFRIRELFSDAGIGTLHVTG